MPRKLSFASLLTQCGILLAVLGLYHCLLRWLMTHHELRLGAISYRLAPLYAYWRPHLKGWLVLPIIILAIYFWVLRRTRLATSMTDRSAIAFFVVSFIGIVITVAMLDGGPRELIAPLLRTDLEYYGAVHRVRGVTQFLGEYSQLASTMPMHAQVHPPGAVLFVWASSKVFGGGPWAAAAGIIGFTSLSVVLVFGWARRLGGPGVARRATALYALAPSVVLFTATSMDGPFAVFLIAMMWLFWESLEHQPFWFGVLAGMVGAGAALMTYSVTVALLFCGLAACVLWITVPEKRISIISASLAALAGFVGLHLILWISTGFNPIEMFRVAVANSNDIMSGTRHESAIRYVHIAVANLVAFFIAAGLPCVVVWGPAIWRALRRESMGSTPRFHNFALTSSLTLLIAASVPVYVLEVERVWMFLIPLVVIPVAGQLFEQERGAGNINGTLAVTVLVAAQTLLTEILLTTYW